MSVTDSLSAILVIGTANEEKREADCRPHRQKYVGQEAPACAFIPAAQPAPSATGSVQGHDPHEGREQSGQRTEVVERAEKRGQGRAEHGMRSSYSLGKGRHRERGRGKRTMERISMRTNLEVLSSREAGREKQAGREGSRQRESAAHWKITRASSYCPLCSPLPLSVDKSIRWLIRFHPATTIVDSSPSLRHFRSSSILILWHPNLGHTGLGL